MQRTLRVPATMATQHPDNAAAPFWERDGDAFVSTLEEVAECHACFEDLGVDEFMWDWEGKLADEGVVDKLFARYFDYFRRHQLGKDKFLTFRLPNIWKEKGYSLIRALMVILTSEDFARDMRLHSPPLFEVILPMTERAEQLVHLQSSFRKLARFKSREFDLKRTDHAEQWEVIPLFESVDHQIGAVRLVERYIEMYQRSFRSKPERLRPFLARSDPALVSGFAANVLANIIALSDFSMLSQRSKVPLYPIIGAGSLVFRGGLAPDRIESFASTYAGVRTVTIQSAFRYDYPRVSVHRALGKLRRMLPQHEARVCTESERRALVRIMKFAERSYQQRLGACIDFVRPLFAAVPARRERRLHIGLLAYAREFGKRQLPRAINFTAAFYSLGIPPEFIGIGSFLAALDESDRRLFMKYYPRFIEDLAAAGRFLNKENIAELTRRYPSLRGLVDDISRSEAFCGIAFGPRTTREVLHRNVTLNTLLTMKNSERAGAFITESGLIRRSLG